MPQRDRLTLSFSDGSTISEWESFTVRESFIDPLGSFQFVAKPDESRRAFYAHKLRKGELVGVKINQSPQFVGLIQTVQCDVDSEGGTVFSFSGASPLVTPYEGAAVDDPLDYSKELVFHSKDSADVPVEDFVKRVMRPYGFSDVSVEAEQDIIVKTGKATKKRRKKISLQDIKHSDGMAHPGETAYGLVARIITRNGVVLRLMWNGTLLVCKPDYEQDISYTFVQDFDGKLVGERFLRVSVTDTNDGQFSECAVRGLRSDKTGDKNTARPIAVVRSDEIDPNRPPYSSSVAPYKPTIIVDKEARDLTKAKNTATLKLGLSASKAFVVKGVVDGFTSSTHRTYTVDTMAHVIVRAKSVDAPMWMLSRAFSQSVDGGQTTEMEFIPKGALRLGEVPGGSG